VTTELEEAIKRRARDFDPCALVELLRRELPEREIRLQSHASTALRPTAVEAVEFHPEHVVVFLNFGLFSSSTPLPAHFHELLTSQRAGPALECLILRLDERLLRDRIDALRPERSPRMLADPARLQKNILRLSAPASPASIQRIAARLFPELSVSAFRAAAHRLLPVDLPRLGYASLGAAALGGHARADVPVIELILRTEETTTWRGEPWTDEAQRRVDGHLLPTLAGTGAYITVLLVDLEGASRLRLRREGLLGKDPLAAGKSPKLSILFEGPVPA
jgi:predicted component of type VI protein secretion system